MKHELTIVGILKLATRYKTLRTTCKNLSLWPKRRCRVLYYERVAFCDFRLSQQSVPSSFPHRIVRAIVCCLHYAAVYAHAWCNMMPNDACLLFAAALAVY